MPNKSKDIQALESKVQQAAASYRRAAFALQVVASQVISRVGEGDCPTVEALKEAEKEVDDAGFKLRVRLIELEETVKLSERLLNRNKEAKDAENVVSQAGA